MQDPADKVKKIVSNQLDLEIHLKRLEVQAIKSELKRSQFLLETLQYVIVHQELPQDMIVKLSEKSMANNEKKRDPSDDHLYHRLPDGQYVRYCIEFYVFSIACPECFRSDFKSMQGFSNHCRNAHQIEFPSHHEAARRCGKIIVRYPC